NRARQAANLQLRICLESIQRVMANGMASTVNVTTPPTTPTVQNSQIQFQSVDGSSCTISLSPPPGNTVQLQKVLPGGATSTTVLANNVTELTFGLNSQDPG